MAQESEGSPPKPPKVDIADQTLVVDYADLRNKRLLRCRLIFRGGRPPEVDNTEFDQCHFIFDGPALNTAHFLSFMAAGEGGRELVLKMLGITK